MWWDMPPPLLRAYAGAMPAIRAGESLERIADHRVGQWPIRKGAAQQRSRELARTAAQHRRARPANQSRLRAAGIRVDDRRTKKGVS